MNFETNYLALIFLLTAVANGWLAILVWPRKKIMGNAYYALFAVAFAIWSFAVYLELSVQEIEWKIFFSKCSYFGVTTAVVFQFLFGLQFSGKASNISVRRWYWLFLISLGFIVLAFTNETHYLLWSDYGVRESEFGTFVLYKSGVFVWVLAFFMWALFVAGMWLIARRLMVGHKIYKQRFFVLMLVFLCPLSGNVFYMFKLQPIPEIDWTPQLFLISFGVLYVIMRKNHLLETLPESRESIFQAMQNPVIIVNSEGRMVDFNPAAENVWPDLGTSLGLSIDQVMPEMSLIHQQFGKHNEVEINRNGNRRWYDVVLSSILTEAKEVRGFVCLFNDITEVRATRELLEISERKLKALNASKDRFFSIIGHDLRSPISAVHGMSQLVIQELDKGELSGGELSMKLGLIEQSATLVLDLVENLLTWAQLQSNGVKIDKKMVNVVRLVEKVMALMSTSANRKQIHLQLKVENECTVLLDSEMISTVMRNLLSNAVKFSYAGDSIEIKVNCTTEWVQISVRDYGKGISSDVKNNLFKIDEKTVRSGTNDEVGTGLGLVLCKEFVDLHNGIIEVYNKEKGTEFVVRIPNAW